jgi:hypothetical protein
MKPSTRILASAAAIAVIASVLHPPHGWIATPAHAKKDKGPAVAPEAFATAAPIVSGPLQRFLVNPQGEVDAFQLGDGTIVKFPPHMSEELVAAVKPGDAVNVRGFREPGGAVKAFVIVNEGNNQQVVERPPAPDMAKIPKHLRYASLARLQVTGAVERPLRGRNGEVNGVLLADGTVVRFPPHAAFDFAALLQPGKAFAAEGLGTENAYGKGLEATAIGPTLQELRPVYGQ